MKKLFIFLLFTVLLFEKYANTQICEVDRAIESKIEKIIASTVSSYLSKVKMVFQDVKTPGAYAYCPSGFIPTSCACGYGCGSWNIIHNSGCHCQCANMDWTTARCVKLS
ncbi:resistin-like [Thamnophis elegans]|uniref:resistin-like n=1 Tax=Thamnophis elegans TaxID=35005 RepID=UPI0013779C81|nr:resistin-like [Thamnophis elegans]XP_032067638.1 resistin-like [Thamnophis elegans]XP_032067639.1 resistin-like [Thamnophis elegans]